jgi:hypothetical protein
MAEAPVINDVTQVSVFGTWQGTPFVNVFHFAWTIPVGAPVTLAGLQVVKTGLQTVGAGGAGRHFFNGIYNLMDTGVVVTDQTYRSFDGDQSQEITGTQAAAGTSGGTDEPGMLAALVKWNAGLVSRKFKGRSYLPGLNGGMLDGTDKDRIDTTFSNTLATRMNDVIAGVIATTAFEMVVLSLKAHNLGEAPPYATLASATVAPFVAIQRRRRD